MYRSNRQGTRSVLADIFGVDPAALLRTQDVLGFEVERTDEGYRIEVPVAGFRPEDITVTVEDRQLTIEGRSDRRRFTRVVVLPDEIDADNIAANVENGLLTLMLPLNAKMQPRRVAVRVGGQEQKSVTGSSTQGQTSEGQTSQGRIGQETQSGTAQSGSSQGAGTAQTVSGEMQGEGERTLQQSR